MRQLNIFEIEERQRLEEKANGYKPPKPREEDVDKLARMIECPTCHVKPVMWHKVLRNDYGDADYTGVKCQVCGFSCGTFYNDIVEHWNNCITAHAEGRL